MRRSVSRLLAYTTDRTGRRIDWWSVHRLVGYGETEDEAREDYAIRLEALAASGLEHGAIGEPVLTKSSPIAGPGVGWHYGPRQPVALSVPKAPAKRR